MKTVRSEFKLIHEDAKVPSKKRPEDAGYDVTSIEDGVIQPMILDPLTGSKDFFEDFEKLLFEGLTEDTLSELAGEPGFKVFRTGVRVAVPSGYFISVRGRSGLGFKGVQPFIGTLDATYNGELLIMLLNHSNKPYQVNKGDRIAQIVIEEQIVMKPVEVEEFSPEYDKRGRAGFGSSGK